MYSALDFAKYIIYKCNKDDILISNLYLQNILYYIQCFNLKNNKNLVFKDDFEAWLFGPVVPDVYYHFSDYGSNSIYVLNLYEFEETLKLRNINLRDIDKIIETKRTLNIWEIVKEVKHEAGSWNRYYWRQFKNIIPKHEIVKDIKYLNIGREY